ncbi:hypothetical protein CMV_023177 [Castanea mollissima]|uniref:Uncharacterized protein n=1 Tax=Castanea mollissima TaxID=60419 RepID=A0A8J4QKT4_9ROSI|nr:hypothetical protein CMV_023177 [Castanea mollissima]
MMITSSSKCDGSDGLCSMCSIRSFGFLDQFERLVLRNFMAFLCRLVRATYAKGVNIVLIQNKTEYVL